MTSRNLVEHSKVQEVEEIEEKKKKKKTVNIAVNALEEPTCAQRWEPWQTCRAPQVRPWASLMRNEPKQHSDHCSEVVAMNSPSAALQRRQPGWALSERDERELQSHSRSLWGSRRLRLPAIPSTHATTDGRTLPAYPSKAKANRTKPLITADTSETSLYKTEAVESKNRRFQGEQWTEHVEKQLQSPHRRRRRWSTWPILTKHTSIESSKLPLSACHGAIAVNRSMRGTIALIVASLNCAMHSTQCDAARFRQKPALQVTSLISLTKARFTLSVSESDRYKVG